MRFTHCTAQITSNLTLNYANGALHDSGRLVVERERLFDDGLNTCFDKFRIRGSLEEKSATA